MIALTKTFGLEHAPRVRANAVAPGPVDTAFLRGGTGRSNEDGASTIDVNVFAAMNPMQPIAVARGHRLAGDVPARPRQRLNDWPNWVNGGAYMP